VIYTSDRIPIMSRCASRLDQTISVDEGSTPVQVIERAHAEKARLSNNK